MFVQKKLSSIKLVARWWLRKILYDTPAYHVLPVFRQYLGTKAVHEEANYWDTELKGRLKSYLGGTFQIDLRNAITVEMVRHIASAATSLLDIGCAAGSLSVAARRAGVTRYVGVDISQTAIDDADRSHGTFYVSDLQSFKPSDTQMFDVIVFNEVLYYLDVNEAAAQVDRYREYLSPNGVIIISMKNDPKSHVIISCVSQRIQWITGLLYQEVPDRPRYRLILNRERPALMLGAFQPRYSGYSPNDH